MTFMKNRRLILLTFVLLFTFVLVNSAIAVDNIQDVNKVNQQQEPESQPTSLILSFFKLILVLGVILAAAWSIIHLFTKQYNAKMQGTWMHVVDEVTLGQNRGIVLCEVGGKVYALGVTDKEINLLFEVDNPKLMEEISSGNYASDVINPQSLPNWITQITRQIQLKKKPESPMKFQNIMQEQSRKIKELAIHNTQRQGSATKRSDEND